MKSLETESVFLPVALNITDKKIVIVGGGNVGYHKATILSRYTDKAVVVSSIFREGFSELPFTLLRKHYDKDDLRGAFLVYICTEDSATNLRIKADAEELGILASVCDNPAQCDFISPAIYKAGDVCIAVTSNARDVRRSIRIRDRVKKLGEENLDFLK